MGSKALPIRLIKFLIIHLHSTGIPPPPHFLSISLALSLLVSLFPSVSPPLPPGSHSLSLSVSHCRSLSLVVRADPFNIFLNYIFNGRNKWIIDCFASVQSANRVIINALLQFSHSYKYIIQSIAERFAEISAKCNLRHTKLYIVRSRNSQFVRRVIFVALNSANQRNSIIYLSFRTGILQLPLVYRLFTRLHGVLHRYVRRGKIRTECAKRH